MTPTKKVTEYEFTRALAMQAPPVTMYVVAIHHVQNDSYDVEAFRVLSIVGKAVEVQGTRGEHPVPVSAKVRDDEGFSVQLNEVKYSFLYFEQEFEEFNETRWEPENGMSRIFAGELGTKEYDDFISDLKEILRSKIEREASKGTASIASY